jgi:hypothetical protein
MTKTERWYAIVEELRASAPRLCSYGFSASAYVLVPAAERQG